jgi:hypothetical protein
MHSGYKLFVTFGAKRRRSLGNVCKHTMWVNGIPIVNNGFDGSELFFFKCKVIFSFNLHFLLFVNITGTYFANNNR